jgi:phage repressor protein C with HTH and peptisase S24 domain
VEGDVFCKIFERSSGGKLVLVSVNTAHAPIELNPDEVAWIYPVAQVTKTMRRR